MASVLTGVYRKLKWADFQALDAVPAGKPAWAAAETVVSHTATGGLPQATTLSGLPPVFHIPDNIAITVAMQPASWRLTSVSRWTGPQQVWLIKHEQGHYDIYALMVRDFFHRIQGMIGETFFDANDLKAQMLAHRAATIGRIAETQKAYDTDTQNSRDGSEQWTWWSAIERASQLHRSPLVKGRDGRFLRIELADALAKAGLA